ncbi:beta-ketoacyl synthase N-terminal-like domain-containing protein [Streptomyces profundus]|uniref:beta-ketoacyl synthase N-terminal-like domain-containing protein n=1 Tax=Streptomyces profundus TaxID=2867410 RepID=UPI001D167A8B|nr:beta-ketoacyl synthase N-terminal-like domain-containing protein [Streptomyces sp. MA3_2.13]UED85092.1 3-oxoacyl-ACP synthase [Streptomyces sp. MA3_2.13]
MNQRTRRPAPVITSWETISPFGVGRAAFRDGILAGAAPEPVPPAGDQVPGISTRPVPDFDVRAVLGKKGTRSMNRVTGLTVATIRELLAGEPEAEESGQRRGTALVLGTTTGSAQSMMDFTHTSLTGKRPYHVDPAVFPNTVMNHSAGSAAIWYGLTGPNVTVAGGRAAGVLAFNYVRRLQVSGRARTVLCGAAEEYSTARAWLRRHSGTADGAAADEPTVLGEGCAMLRVEAEAERGLADVLAVRSGVFAAPEEAGRVLVASVRRALADAEVAPGDLWAVAADGPLDAGGGAAGAALDELLRETGARRISCVDRIGDTASAAGMFQVVSLLVHAESEPSDRPRIGLVTSVDRDGVAGCAVLSVRPTGGQAPTSRPA